MVLTCNLHLLDDSGGMEAQRRRFNRIGVQRHSGRAQWSLELEEEIATVRKQIPKRRERQ